MVSKKEESKQISKAIPILNESTDEITQEVYASQLNNIFDQMDSYWRAYVLKDIPGIILKPTNKNDNLNLFCVSATYLRSSNEGNTYLGLIGDINSDKEPMTMVKQNIRAELENMGYKKNTFNLSLGLQKQVVFSDEIPAILKDLEQILRFDYKK